MKLRNIVLLLFVFAFALSANAFATTWYIRSDGGGRYSAGRVSGANLLAGPQTGINVGCNGQANVSYSAAVAAGGGATTNLPCAYNDPRFLWDDQTYQNSQTQGMVVQGGDTVIIGLGAWRVGYDAQPGSCSGAGCGAGYTWGYGGGPLVVAWPSGTSGAHTKIYGVNYASCATGTDWSTSTKSAMSELFGGWGIPNPIELSGSQYVDLQCLNIDRHSNCIYYGTPAVPSTPCNSSPVQDFDSDGIHTNATTSNIFMEDMWIHGHTGRGIKGGIGGPVTCQRCNIDTNGETGWDFDDGTTHLIGAGAYWHFLHSVVQWSGCNQEYPFVDPIPVATCYSQSTGGQGDGVGTPAGTGMSVDVEFSGFIYNTQDGLDLGHVDTGGPYTGLITNSYAYGNSGGTFKFDGAFGTMAVTNNYVVANCIRLAYPITGVPTGFNTNNTDYCRAGDTWPFQVFPGDQFTFANNTIVTYSPTIFDYDCVSSTTTCATSSVLIYDNIIIGFDNPATYTLGGVSGGPNLFCGHSCNGNGIATDPILTISHNDYYNVRNTTCPTGNPGDICTSPLFVGQPTGTAGTFVQSELDAFNINLTSGSPAIGAGITYSGIPSTDYFLHTQTTPPVIGAAIFSTTQPAFIRMLGARILGRMN